MKKRIKLKSNTYFYLKERDKAILIIMLVISLTFYFSFVFNKKSKAMVLEIAKNESTLLTTFVINAAVEKSTNLFESTNDFVIESKDKEGKIISVDFNTINVNKTLTIINKNILENLKKIEKGNFNSLDVEPGFNYIKHNGNIIYQIPFGIISNNIFINSLGPKIPLKMNPVGRITSQIKTSVEHYGINNVLFKMFIEVEVSELIILPFISETVSISTNIPIVIKIIEGSIPSVYGGLLTSTSSLNTLNVK